MKSNSLRDQIKRLLEDVKNAYDVKEVSYKNASPDAMYPHITYEIIAVDVSDLTRDDYNVDIDIYTRDDEETALDIGDSVQEIFSSLNAPDREILPTYFLVTRQSVEDPDKHIKHEAVRLQVQLYEAEEE